MTWLCFEGEEGPENAGRGELTREGEGWTAAAKHEREREKERQLPRPPTIYILRISALLTNLALISTFSTSLC